jgi:hypothetical protein
MPNGISFNSNNLLKMILHFKTPYEISTEPVYPNIRLLVENKALKALGEIIQRDYSEVSDFMMERFLWKETRPKYGKEPESFEGYHANSIS